MTPIMFDQGIVELFLRGGIVMWPLLLCSVFALALILERILVFFWCNVPFSSLAARLERFVRAGQLVQARDAMEQSRSPVAQVAAAFLRHLHSPAQLREEVVSRVASQQIARMERRLNWLALLAQVTPLLGLLGTVIGLMIVFHQMDLKGSQVQTADLAVGMWQKLLNTAFGMVIAIPCLIVYYWLENWSGRIAQQMEWITSYLQEWLNPLQSSNALATSPSGNGNKAQPVVPGRAPVQGAEP
jgi:biopolymer transport protein ExbB